jgi:hypothetical protein
MRVTEPTLPNVASPPSSSEATIELPQATIELEPPPPTIPRERPVEKTLELSEADLFASEETLPEFRVPKKP